MNNIPLPPGVRFLVYNPKELEAIWDRIKGLDNLFGNDYMRDPETYLRRFFDPDVRVLAFPTGLVVFSGIIPGLKAEIHPVFFDRKLSPHVELYRDLLTWGFLTWDLLRIEAFVAAYARAILRFSIKKMGFTHEGTLRERIVHNGTPTDVEVLSILRREVLE